MKKNMNKFIIICILIYFSTIICGCWDYTEMNNVNYVAGMAVDKDNNTNEYILTLEVLEAAADSNSIKSTILESRGKTIHTAIRDVIKQMGKIPQVSHTAIFIVSETIAREGMIPVIDLINRDVEVRNDMWVLISETGTASEILYKGKKEEEIISYKIVDTIRNSKKIGKYGETEIFKLIKDISTKGISPKVPMIKLIKDKENVKFQILGTAIFKGEKMVGKLNENETLFLQLLTKNNLKFVMPIVIKENQNISFELINNNKKIKVKTKNNKVAMDVYLDMDVALSELSETGVNYVSKKERDKLQKNSERYIEDKCSNLIKKLQNEYDADIIGFGTILKQKKSREWEKVSENWNEAFKDIDINVFVNIDIKNSGLTKKNIKVGE